MRETANHGATENPEERVRANPVGGIPVMPPSTSHMLI